MAPHVVTYDALISAFDKGMRPERALEPLWRNAAKPGAGHRFVAVHLKSTRCLPNLLTTARCIPLASHFAVAKPMLLAPGPVPTGGLANLLAVGPVL